MEDNRAPVCPSTHDSTLAIRLRGDNSVLDGKGIVGLGAETRSRVLKTSAEFNAPHAGNGKERR
jgi:hypothetical protein